MGVGDQGYILIGTLNSLKYFDAAKYDFLEKKMMISMEWI